MHQSAVFVGSKLGLVWEGALTGMILSRWRRPTQTTAMTRRHGPPQTIRRQIGKGESTVKSASELQRGLADGEERVAQGRNVSNIYRLIGKLKQLQAA